MGRGPSITRHFSAGLLRFLEYSFFFLLFGVLPVISDRVLTPTKKSEPRLARLWWRGGRQRGGGDKVWDDGVSEAFKVGTRGGCTTSGLTDQGRRRYSVIQVFGSVDNWDARKSEQGGAGRTRAAGGAGAEGGFVVLIVVVAR